MGVLVFSCWGIFASQVLQSVIFLVRILRCCLESHVVFL